MLARIFAVLVLVVSCMAQVHAQDDTQLVITTRSTGTMSASPGAQYYLQMPVAQFDYELRITTEVSRTFVGNDPMWLRSSGYGSLTLTGNGSTWTDRDPLMFFYTDATFSSDVPYGGTDESFTHDIFTVLALSPVLEGYHRVSWPAGSFPGTMGFHDQDWTFDGPGVGEVYMAFHHGSDAAGWIEGRADHFEMSISAVPEPARVTLLVAGLGILGLSRRFRKARSLSQRGAAPCLPV